MATLSPDHPAADPDGLRPGPGQSDHPDHQRFGISHDYRGARAHARGERHPIDVLRAICGLRERGVALLAVVPHRRDARRPDRAAGRKETVMQVLATHLRTEAAATALEQPVLEVCG